MYQVCYCFCLVSQQTETEYNIKDNTVGVWSVRAVQLLECPLLDISVRVCFVVVVVLRLLITKRTDLFLLDFHDQYIHSKIILISS